MQIIINNSQRRHTLHTKNIKVAALALAAKAEQRARHPLPWQEIVIHLLDNAGIAPINEAVMGHKGATDVITQSYLPLPGEDEGLTAELFVNVEQAYNSAPKRQGWSPDRELALYLAHGFDHLSGATDDTPTAQRSMRQRELRWLRTIPLTPLYK